MRVRIAAASALVTLALASPAIARAAETPADPADQPPFDDASGEVIEAWTGSQVDTKLARGYEDAVAGDVNEWWIWLPLCVLFIVPFVDPRRPFRLLHL